MVNRVADRMYSLRTSLIRGFVSGTLFVCVLLLALQRSHYTHPEAVSLNGSVGVERIETIQERLFEARFGLVAGKWAGSHCKGEL